jgi:hypothetical protein
MILPVGFSLLLRRWLATLLFGVLALCGGLLMSGASAGIVRELPSACSPAPSTRPD